MKLLIWGAGGHGKVVLECALATGAFEAIVFVDDACLDGPGKFCGWPVAGNPSQLETVRDAGFSWFAVSIGDNRARARCFELAAGRGLLPATIVHPAATMSPSADVGEGTVVMPGAALNAGARVGRNCIINTAAVVEHDCIVGDHAHISPGAVLGGGVRVGAFAHLGLGAIALPGVAIGEGAVVGAGSVVLKTIPAGVTAAGVPARILTRRMAV